MLFERIESEGLAHYSYLIGDGNAAAVIDPRRDGEVYVAQATAAGLPITHIFETHRHEDYVSGSVELAARTGAEIWHADAQLPYAFGAAVADQQTWMIGRLKLQALHTPGHTPGAMSYLLHDLAGAPWVVFSGDTLFAGDVGRVDFLGMEHAAELAGQLHDSIYDRLLPLGDGILLCPAHGAGSACGTAIADRPWTTLGLERRFNPRLNLPDKAAFIRSVAVELNRAPYFRRMEQLNVAGAPLLGSLPPIVPLSPAQFVEKMAAGAQVVDTRSELAFGAAHVPGALALWPQGLTTFAGWFLSYERPLLLVGEGNDVTPAVRKLLRMGYDQIQGFLANGMAGWHTAGKASEHIEMLTVQTLCDLLDADGDVHVLDVRNPPEVQATSIPGAQNIPLPYLPQRVSEVPRDRPVYIFCGSGMRATLAASILQRAGWRNLKVVLGGMAGWTSIACPMPQKRDPGVAWP